MLTDPPLQSLIYIKQSLVHHLDAAVNKIIFVYQGVRWMPTTLNKHQHQFCIYIV